MKKTIKKLFMKFLDYIDFYPEFDDFRIAENNSDYMNEKTSIDPVTGSKIERYYTRYKNGYIKVYMQVPKWNSVEFRERVAKIMAKEYPNE